MYSCFAHHHYKTMWALFVLTLFFFLPNNAHTKPIFVVTTTGMIADVVDNIGGVHFTVKNLMDSGVDPHLYRPTGGDIQALKQADMVFYNGYYLEGRMEQVLKKMAKSKMIYAVTEEIDAPLIYTEDKTVDPHVWMDVSLWQKVAKFIYSQLAQRLPEVREDLYHNYQIYDKKLSQLDQRIRQQISRIPKKRRILVTAHDAFSYFGRAYHIKVVALQGINTADEFGLSDVLALQQVIIDNQVKSIFLENSVPAKFMQSLQKGLAQKNIKVSIGGELFSDAMGTKGTVEGTYIGMMAHNAETISTHLQ